MNSSSAPFRRAAAGAGPADRDRQVIGLAGVTPGKTFLFFETIRRLTASGWIGAGSST
jgi:hypothetical protein